MLKETLKISNFENQIKDEHNQPQMKKIRTALNKAKLFFTKF